VSKKSGLSLLVACEKKKGAPPRRPSQVITGAVRGPLRP